MKYVAYVIGSVVGLFVVFAIIGQTDPQGEAKSKERAGIKLCWTEYERKSLTEAADGALLQAKRLGRNRVERAVPQ